MSLYPQLYSTILANQQQAAQANQLKSEGLYLELVEFVTNALPQRLTDIVQKQLLQLKTMNINTIGEHVALQLEGDQYRAYTAVTNSIINSRHTGVHFFITGPGGTGKSFLLKSLEVWCHRSKQKPLLLSPTGIAANNITGNTIHSALSTFSDGTVYRSSIFSGDTGRANELRTIKVLIIDEVSMVDAQLFTFISTIFSRLHQNSKPFGNIHVILFGDLMQLPPVSGLKIFNAPAWRLFHPLFLNQPQRQTKDLKFFYILNKIRFGEIDEEVKEALQQQANHFDLATQTYTTTFLCSLKTDAFRMNKLMLSTLPEFESADSIFRSIDCEEGRVLKDNEDYDDRHDLRTFKKGTNFPRTVTCVIGAKVMFLTNSMIDQVISNGTCGIIVSLRPNGEPNVAFPTRHGIRVRQLIPTLRKKKANLNKTVEVGRDTSYFIANGISYSRCQLPLQNAFALTIHKVQGLSMSMITVSLDANIFSEGQAYTAISRGRQLKDVCIAGLDWSAFKVD
jgi:ATP-dependent DNA helicase PIF1